MSEYKVEFEVFAGPLDLLLYLVKKEEVDIYNVNLTQLATQFLEYLEVMRELDLEIAGEFLVMAASLLYIKSRELLPIDQQAPIEGEEAEEIDPKWELIRQLVEYKKFKDAAARLQAMEIEQEAVFPHLPPRTAAPEPAAPPPKPEVSVFDLIHAVGAILKRFQERRPTQEIVDDRWTVSEKIDHLRQVLNERQFVTFTELFASSANRYEVVTTFLALLELVRLKWLVAVQPEPFTEIEIRLADSVISSTPVSA